MTIPTLTCSVCKQRIVWARDAATHIIAKFDSTPDPAGTVVIVHDPDRGILCRELDAGENYSGPLYSPHQPSCDAACRARTALAHG